MLLSQLMDCDGLFNALNDTRGDSFHEEIPLSRKRRYKLVLHESIELFKLWSLGCPCCFATLCNQLSLSRHASLFIGYPAI